MHYSLMPRSECLAKRVSNRVVLGVAGLLWLALLAGDLASSSQLASDTDSKRMKTADAATVMAVGPDAVEPLPIIVSVIMEPSVMFRFYGFVAPPLLVLSVKGLFNFAVQTVFYLNSTIFEGLGSIRDKLGADAGESVRFGKLSISFQVLGQVTAVVSYCKLAQATRPWDGSEESELFYYLVSQHSSSVSLLVGLGNNLMLTKFMKGGNVVFAKTLVATGVLIGTPLWAACAITMWPWGYMFLGLATFVGFAFMIIANTLVDSRSFAEAVSVFWELLQDGYTTDILVLSSLFFPIALSVVWLVFSIGQLHAWLLFLATMVEYFVPLFALVLVYPSLASQTESYLKIMLYGFFIAMGGVYIVTMTVPASILASQPGSDPFKASPDAFWGKKILPFLSFTFITPARHLVANASNNAYVHAVELWVVQLFSLFS